MSKVIDIYIAEQSGGPMLQKASVDVEQGRGIVGDRYYTGEGTFSKKLSGLPDKEITLIEAEQIEQFNQAFNYSFAVSDFRRNLITEGVSLNDLEGKEFTVGELRLKGIRLCEPCAYLAKRLVGDILLGMVGKAGLRAQVLKGGVVKLGDSIKS